MTDESGLGRPRPLHRLLSRSPETDQGSPLDTHTRTSLVHLFDHRWRTENFHGLTTNRFRCLSIPGFSLGLPLTHHCSLALVLSTLSGYTHVQSFKHIHVHVHTWSHYLLCPSPNFFTYDSFLLIWGFKRSGNPCSRHTSVHGTLDPNPVDVHFPIGSKSGRRKPTVTNRERSDGTTTSVGSDILNRHSHRLRL